LSARINYQKEEASMTKEERVLRQFTKEEVDYLPSEITFSDRTRDKEISKAVGLASPDELDDYLENHIYWTLTKHDAPLFSRNDEKVLGELQEEGYCRMDLDRGIVFDSWGIGIEMHSDGFFVRSHPLQPEEAGGENKEYLRKMLPPDFNTEILDMNLEDAIKNYTGPDIDRKGNFDTMEKDMKERSGEIMVVPSGYFGIYERAYSIMGFEEFIMELALRPKMVEILLDKITDYKVEVAKRKVRMGAKVGHHGDDLGAQTTTLMSRKMFREMIKPRMDSVFKVYRDAGLPIILHSCGHITDIIPDLIEIGLTGLHPVQPSMDLNYLKKEFGKDLVFWGGIDTQDKLPYGTPEEVKKLAKDTIRTLGIGGGHIIAPAQEVMNDVPIDNIKALVETIIEERQKVLSL
jgi:uroporphyrinogen decarboxylase